MALGRLRSLAELAWPQAAGRPERRTWRLLAPAELPPCRCRNRWFSREPTAIRRRRRLRNGCDASLVLVASLVQLLRSPRPLRGWRARNRGSDTTRLRKIEGRTFTGGGGRWTLSIRKPGSVMVVNREAVRTTYFHVVRNVLVARRPPLHPWTSVVRRGDLPFLRRLLMDVPQLTATPFSAIGVMCSTPATLSDGFASFTG